MPADLRRIDQAEADRLIRERAHDAQASGTRIDEFLAARIVDVTLTVSTNLMPVSFGNSDLERVRFDSSNLEDASFDRSRLKGCDLSNLNAGRLWAAEAVFDECRF